MSQSPWNIGTKLKASDWAKRYAFENGFSIYSKQISAVLAFLDAMGCQALFPEKDK